MKSSQQGFAHIILLIVIVVIALAVWAKFYFFPKPVAIGTNNIPTVPIAPPSSATTTKTKTFTDAKYKFSLTYPAHWILKQGNAVSVQSPQNAAPTPGPNGSYVDFIMKACKVTDADCADTKKYLTENIKDKYRMMNMDSSINLAGKKGFQGVIAGSGYYYYIVIEDKGIIYSVRHESDYGETKYPDNFPDKNVKAIIDSIKFP